MVTLETIELYYLINLLEVKRKKNFEMSTYVYIYIYMYRK